MYVGDIHASGVHLLTVINDMLDLSKAEAGRIELHETKVDVAAAIHGSLAMVRSRADNAGVSFRIELQPGLPQLLADELRIKQILLNLLSNAVKFTPSGGKVLIEATGDSAGLAVAVVDTGIGIAEADIPRILTPFVQIQNIYTRKREGTGLGLPLTKQLVELHRGRLDIRSASGKGTTVTVRFPPERIVNAPIRVTDRAVA
jgi:signal transduction histidine kinase